MKIALKYEGSYCDKRILDLGFVDNCWSNNVTGSVYKEINGKGYEVFCPLPEPDQGNSHSGLEVYTVSIDDEFIDRKFTADELLAFLQGIAK